MMLELPFRPPSPEGRGEQGVRTNPRGGEGVRACPEPSEGGEDKTCGYGIGAERGFPI